MRMVNILPLIIVPVLSLMLRLMIKLMLLYVFKALVNSVIAMQHKVKLILLMQIIISVKTQHCAQVVNSIHQLQVLCMMILLMVLVLCTNMASLMYPLVMVTGQAALLHTKLKTILLLPLWLKLRVNSINMLPLVVCMVASIMANCTKAKMWMHLLVNKLNPLLILHTKTFGASMQT